MPLHKPSEVLAQEVALWLLPSVNQRRLAKLYLEFTDAPDFTQASAKQLLTLIANSPTFKQDQQLLARQALNNPWQLPYANKIKEQLIWAEAPNHWLLSLTELPLLLHQLADPPLMLSLIGNPQELEAPNLAIVGSRRLSPEGQELAFNWANHLAFKGINILSGLARGVDSFAHQGALLANSQGAPATTSAVLAHGLDMLYPPEHAQLAEQISQTGALISEFPLGVQPLPRHFPQRNRLVTGLSLGVLVVEATLRSGSLVSARHAMEQGREVMAVPGSVKRPQSQGCHQLIRQGAALVTNPTEVLAELEVPLASYLPPNKPANSSSQELLNQLSPLAAKVLAQLTDATQTPDQLAQQLNLSAAEVLISLQELQLEGLAANETGGWCLGANLLSSTGSKHDF